MNRSRVLLHQVKGLDLLQEYISGSGGRHCFVATYRAMQESAFLLLGSDCLTDAYVAGRLMFIKYARSVKASPAWASNGEIVEIRKSLAHALDRAMDDAREGGITTGPNYEQYALGARNEHDFMLSLFE